MVELPQMVIELARLVRENNGRAYLVGGCVRDGLLDRSPKDLDVEVHGLEEARLVQVLRTLGTVKEVGKAFGVYKLVGVDMEIDVSLPRRDSRTADRDPFLGEKIRNSAFSCHARLMTCQGRFNIGNGTNAIIG